MADARVYGGQLASCHLPGSAPAGFYLEGSAMAGCLVEMSGGAMTRSQVSFGGPVVLSGTRVSHVCFVVFGAYIDHPLAFECTRAQPLLPADAGCFDASGPWDEVFSGVPTPSCEDAPIRH
jgi:hypothetical protein